jgi:single stranded DNA-binding protein
MIDRNDCRFIGSIHNIEEKVTPSGMRIVTAGVKVSNGKKQDGTWRDATWFNVKAFDKTAEVVAGIPDKSRVMVKARMTVDKYTDRSGQDRQKYEFIIDGIEQLVTRQYNNSASEPASRPAPARARTPEPEPESYEELGADDTPDDDIPF